MSMKSQEKTIIALDEDGRGIEISTMMENGDLSGHVSILNCIADVDPGPGIPSILEDVKINLSFIIGISVLYEIRDFLNYALPDKEDID